MRFSVPFYGRLSNHSAVVKSDWFDEQSSRVVATEVYALDGTLLSSQCCSTSKPTIDVHFPSVSNRLFGEETTEGFVWRELPNNRTFSAKDKHGNVAGSEFGTPVWKGNSALFYTAFLLPPKSASAASEWTGAKLGEGYATSVVPAVFRLDLETGQIDRVDKFTEGIFVSNPCVVGDKLYVIAHRSPNGATRGVKYCSNRERFIALIDETGHVNALQQTEGFGLRDLLCFDGRLLAWTAAKSPFTHQSAYSVCMVDPQIGKRPLVYVDGLDELEFSRGGFCTFQKESRRVLAHLNHMTGEFRTFSAVDDSHVLWTYTVLDVLLGSGGVEDQALVLASSQQRGFEVFRTTSSLSSRQVIFRSLAPTSATRFTTEIVNEGDARYVLHKQTRDMSPLILFLHGGPHFSVDTAFSRLFEAFLDAGFSMLCPNYVGSLGYEGVEDLAGAIGQLDLNGVVASLNYETKRHPASYSSIHCFGGSHGGYLGATLYGSPEQVRFSSFVLRNPVVELSSLFFTSDIPDWAIVEALGIDAANRYGNMSAATRFSETDHAVLIKRSPLFAIDTATVPLLLGIGAKDLRVPPAQGKLLYSRLQELNAPARMLLFEEGDHSLAAKPSVLKTWIDESIKFMQQNEKNVK